MPTKRRTASCQRRSLSCPIRSASCGGIVRSVAASVARAEETAVGMRGTRARLSRNLGIPTSYSQPGDHNPAATICGAKRSAEYALVGPTRSSSRFRIQASREASHPHLRSSGGLASASTAGRLRLASTAGGAQNRMPQAFKDQNFLRTRAWRKAPRSYFKVLAEEDLGLDYFGNGEGIVACLLRGGAAEFRKDDLHATLYLPV